MRVGRTAATVPVRGVVTALILTSVGCHSLQLDNSPSRGRQLWATEGGDSGRSHMAPHELKTPLQQVWQYNAAAGFGPGGPLIVGDHIIVANRKGEVHAIDAERGKKRGVKGFGDAIDGTPTLEGNLLFVPVAWGRKTGVVAFNLERGAREWMHRCAPVATGVLAAGDRIVFVDDEPTLFALDLTGAVLWTLPLEERSVITGSPVLVGDRTVAIADDTGRVYGIDLRSGEVQWMEELGEPVYVSMSSDSGRLYVPTTRAGLFALDGTTGRRIWRYRGQNERVRLATPAASESRVVVGGSDGRIVALSAETGAVHWTWQGEGAITAATVIVGSTVFVGAMDATARGLDLVTGEELWSSELRGRIKSAPAVGSDAIYFLSEPRYLYRFSTSEEVDGNG